MNHRRYLPVLLVIALGTLLSSCGSVLAPAAAFRGPAADPVEYLEGRMSAHDVLLLGEMHEQKETLDFVAASVAPLHGRGMRVFATEFLRSRNTRKAQKIVDAEVFDRAACVDLFRDFAWIWSYGEYVDIFEAIWKVNKDCPRPDDRIRVVGLDFEWQDWSGAVVESSIDRDVWMADRLLEALQPGDKAVVHCGQTHSLAAPGLDRPTLAKETARRTTLRLFRVTLHHRSVPLDGQETASSYRGCLSHQVDEILDRRQGLPFAFDVRGTSLEGFRDSYTWYLRLTGRPLEDFTDGLVVLRNSATFSQATWIEGFVNDTNRAKALEIIRTRGWFDLGSAEWTNEDLNRRLGDFFKES